MARQKWLRELLPILDLIKIFEQFPQFFAKNKKIANLLTLLTLPTLLTQTLGTVVNMAPILNVSYHLSQSQLGTQLIQPNYLSLLVDAANNIANPKSSLTGKNNVGELTDM